MAISINELKAPQWLRNGICPYFTMFPLNYPVSILNEHMGDVAVLDPFCGRGTSLFAAKMFGYSAYGIDSNPMAVVISRAKLADVSVSAINDTLCEALEYTGHFDIPEGEFWDMAYEKITLQQLCKIRKYLLENKGAQQDVLTALMLGSLHGPRAKNLNNNSYFSNQMPRTYASKPGYAVKYWKKNDMQPDRIDIARIINKKALRFYAEQLPNIDHSIIHGDSRSEISFDKLPKVSTIITSPPYYGMKTYYTDQWLRNWFLGGADTPNYSLDKQFQHDSPISFAQNLGQVWRNCAKAASENAKMYVRFGGISSKKADALDIFMNSLDLAHNAWRLVHCEDAGTSLLGKRQATQMLSTKKSNPTKEYDLELILDA